MKTTKKHYELFKKECLKLQDKYHLGHWDIAFLWENLDEKGFDGAAIDTYYTKHCTITYDTDIDKENLGGLSLTDYVIESAKHEMTHLLCRDLVSLSYDRHAQKQELEKQEEALVRKLVKLL